MKRTKKYRIINFFFLCIFGLLILVSNIWAASGSITITSPSPSEIFYAQGNGFSVQGTYIMTKDDTPSTPNGVWEADQWCPEGLARYTPSYYDRGQGIGDYAYLYSQVDGNVATHIGTIYYSVYGYSALGRSLNFSSYTNINGLDPNVTHTLKIYLQDIYGAYCKCSSWWCLYGVYDCSARTGEIFAQSTQQFQICSACNLKINNYPTTPITINPSAGGTVSLNATIADSSCQTKSWTLEIKNSTGTVVRRFTGTSTAVTVTWDGKDTNGSVVPEGSYTATLSAKTADGSCRDEKNILVVIQSACTDSDHDGFYAYNATTCPQGNDCDDTNPTINPNTIWYKDADGDKYPDINYPAIGPQCNRPVGYTAEGELKSKVQDCDDAKSDLNPEHPCGKKKLASVSGDGQEGDIFTTPENPFVVKVVDENNNPTTGNVVWQVTSTPQDAQGQSLSTTSGLNSTFTLGDTLGDYQVTVTCTDCTENKTVTFTAKASGPKITLRFEPEEVWPNKTGGNSVAEVIVEVTSYNGRLLNGYGLEFKAEADKTSGGHNSGHDEGRPVGSFSDNSICYTDNGQCEVKYTASEFGGKEKITAKLQSLRFQRIPSQSKDLTVKVSDLFGLPGGGVFRLTGQTQQHLSNHYGTYPTIVNTNGIGNDFYALFDATLGMNDMSLPMGGGFDIFGNWLEDITSPQCRQSGRGHCSHRKGTSVDIDRCAQSTTPNNPNSQGACPDGWIGVDKDTIEHLCWKNGKGWLARESTIHCESPQ